MEAEAALRELAERIVNCGRCPRLRGYCEEVARVKRRAYREWTYWGRPLPGFGDPHAVLLIIGLAPAAHGGNRTGRMFTGNGSGDWLIRALYEVGLANQPTSLSRGDGLELRSTYITAVVRCAPPGNKPLREEIDNCSTYLSEELRLLRNVRLVLTLGRVAFNAYLGHVTLKAGRRPVFKHGALYDFGCGQPHLIASYHPSRQNTLTGKLRWEDWMDIFIEARRMIDEFTSPKISY
ncbi:MAG: uracil-DNA glycosylase [Candidatus Bathyarchaeia archaeon]